MTEKNIGTRIQHKHDIEANWDKAVNFIPKAGELIIYDADTNFDRARVKIGDGLTTVINLPFYLVDELETFSVSWNDLKDKPFGEVGSNTLTWDGNIAGLKTITQDGGENYYVSGTMVNYYKVSDIVVTMGDLDAGLILEYNHESATNVIYLMTTFDKQTEVIQMDDSSIGALAVDEYGNTWYGVLFRNDGIYFAKDFGMGEISNYMRIYSITIPNFKKFPVIKPIDTKYLPEALQFGKISDSGTSDTLKFDDTEKHDYVVVYYPKVTDPAGNIFNISTRAYKVSDVPITMDALSGNNITVTIHDYICDEQQGLEEDKILTLRGIPTQKEDGTIYILAVDEDDWSYPSAEIYIYPDNSTYPAGIYFSYYDERSRDDYKSYTCVTSLTVEGYDKFVNTTTKPIETKYLPEHLQFGHVDKNDTLTWDGDLNTPCVIITNDNYTDNIGNVFGVVYDKFYKVSDNIITKDDLGNGAEVTYHRYLKIDDSVNYDGYTPVKCTFDNGLIKQNEDGSFYLQGIDENGNGAFSYGVYIYPENSTHPAGIYFGGLLYEDDRTYSNEYISSLTIPNYGKFSDAKPIKQEYFPEHLQFGDSIEVSNTFTWDGDTTGLDMDYNIGMYKVSDVVITADDLANGLSYEYYMDKDYPYILSTVDVPNLINYENPYGIGVAMADWMGNTFYGILFTNNGIYMYCEELSGSDEGTFKIYPRILTIHGCDKFVTAKIKTLETKYLPEHLQLGELNYVTEVLKWNGNTEGLYSVEDRGNTYYKISDSIITLDDVANGVVIVWTDAEGAHYKEYQIYTGEPFDLNTVFPIHETNGMLYMMVVDMVTGTTFDGVICYPEGAEHPAGIYFIEPNARVDFNCTVTSFRINGGYKFNVSTFKKLDPKYLPDNIGGGMPEVTAEDNGKILRVVDGAWAAVTLPIYNGEVEDV